MKYLIDNIEELQTLLEDIPACLDIEDLDGYINRANELSKKEFEGYSACAAKAITKIHTAYKKRKEELETAIENVN